MFTFNLTPQIIFMMKFEINPKIFLKKVLLAYNIILAYFLKF